MAWERSGGTGVVRHIKVVGRSAGRPRALAVIAMSEGFRVHSRVIAVPPETVHVGALVRLAVDVGPGPRELVFRPCDLPRGDEW
ncbi:OB-fold domain-containing protein [Streptomyces sp. LHD-70]|uniref:OB-fold domain-containing protein n=1 Tax=Streptomyces sp. LHD-70 TaxID=3072140 RepID=UPI0035BE383C